MSERPTIDTGQTLLEHLNELRIRMTWIVLGLLVATIISFSFTQQLLDFLIAPYGEELQTLSPTEGLETYFKVALVSGASLSMPIVLYHLWRFVSPGLHSYERRNVFVFVPVVFLFFMGGVTFAWKVLLPSAIDFLSTFMTDVFAPEWTSQEYIGFATTFLFWLGVSFELPLVFYFLARAGIVNSRMLREYWRFAMVGIAFLAAAITPSIDPVTMLLTMLPLTILYLLSILLAALGQRQFEKKMTLEE